MGSIVTFRGVALDLPDGRALFRHLDFSVDDGLSALVGPNGVGKTCLARLVVGELAPTAGTIQRHRALAWLPQREPPPPVSVAELLADCAWTPLGERLLDGIDRDARCTTLSGGEWMRVRLARAVDERFLVLDEPTNDLDGDARAVLREVLCHHRGGALVISHDRACLALCDDVFELSNRGLARFGGGFAAYLEAQKAERERLRAELDAARRTRDAARRDRVEARARQEKRNRRGAEAAARGGMPKILIGARKRRAQATTGRVDVATERRLDDAVRAAHEAFAAVKVDPVMYADLVGAALPAQRLVAEARELNVRFSRWVFQKDVSFTWRGPVRVAVAGANGAGKSTLLQALVGGLEPSRGRLRLGGLRALYLDQRLAQLDDAKSVLDNVRAVATASDRELRNGLARFLFTGDAALQRVGSLSGGERLRVALARGFLAARAPELLVLDEPTNNLDLANVAFLEGLARAFGGALVVVSHDDVFLERCGVEEVLALD